ncbi:protein phosphatase 2C 51-like [Dioscorea cayenensis subsp. rotundata]|uniref:protein-serine/threonine phosphatase n=1 Tax=Dioscorea cayennensis subsp. rotundata TaxID=55577 RepID=A0AB40ANN7_DIOCR|nr:protein phosphatase 2C 51-like [Dioscorea cayenensis subsp. rotundata]
MDPSPRELFFRLLSMTENHKEIPEEGDFVIMSGTEGVSENSDLGSGRWRRAEIRRGRSDNDRELETGSADENMKRIRGENQSSDDSSSGEPSSSSSSSTSHVSAPSSDSETIVVYGDGGLTRASVSVVGRRREMEDAVTMAPGFSEGYDFYGVYDGHGGAKVARVCRDRMHVVLTEEVRVGAEDEVGWKEALIASFAKVDGEVVEAVLSPRAEERTVGSTAVVAVVDPKRIMVANCGDSRAVLSRGGVAVPLSTDHKPERPDEMERIEAAGGRVINWNGYRVLGVLATSRSIGDYYLKPYVISEPEVTVVDRTEKDEFIILATDGLWDVVSNQVACKVARQCLSGRAAKMFPEAVRGRTAVEAATLLVELAMSRGSKDNISVVVIELKKLKGTKTSRGS